MATIASLRRLRKVKLTPNPVYCARFATGERVRVSFLAYSNRPLDFAACRRGICQIIGNERGRKAVLGRPHVFPVEGTPRQVLLNTRWPYPVDAPVRIGVVTVPAWRVTRQDLIATVFPPASDLVEGWVEHADRRIPDPHFLVPTGVEATNFVARRMAL